MVLSQNHKKEKRKHPETCKQTVKELLHRNGAHQLCYLNDPTTEKHLNNFLDYGKKTCMVYANSSPKKALNSNNLMSTCISNSSTQTFLQLKFEDKTCGRFLSDPLSLENALSQKTLISLFSELDVRSVPLKLSADLSQRFLEKQKMTTCGHKLTYQGRFLLTNWQQMNTCFSLMLRALL